jgi:hypothetical protein
MSKNQLLKSLQATARQDYANVTAGFAYNYTGRHNNENGIRLEAPDIGLEFSNGVPLGRGLFSKPSSLTHPVDIPDR